MNAQTFIDALRAIEERSDVSAMCALFADESETRNSTVDKTFRGREGADRFWRSYRAAFDEVRSEFHTVVERGDIAVLEWTSSGRTAHGSEFHYDGVSVVDFHGGAICRFRAYFDPAALTPTSNHVDRTAARATRPSRASGDSDAGAAPPGA